MPDDEQLDELVSELPEDLQNLFECVGKCPGLSPHSVHVIRQADGNVITLAICAMEDCGAVKSIQARKAKQCPECLKYLLAKPGFGTNPTEHICRAKQERLDELRKKLAEPRKELLESLARGELDWPPETTVGPPS